MADTQEALEARIAALEVERLQRESLRRDRFKEDIAMDVAMRDNDTKRIYKEAVKEGLKEWLSENWSAASTRIVSWAAKIFFMALFVAVVALILKSQGWSPPHTVEQAH